MNPTFLVILPLPSRAEVTAWERLLPQDVFPDMLKMLMVLALQTRENVQNFVDDSLTLFEHEIGELPDPLMDKFLNLLVKESFLDYFLLMLEALHARMVEVTDAVLGPNPHLYRFNQVVSYRAMGAICVEMTHVLAPSRAA